MNKYTNKNSKSSIFWLQQSLKTLRGGDCYTSITENYGPGFEIPQLCTDSVPAQRPYLTLAFENSSNKAEQRLTMK